jgi:ligand-binding sensor domain-containing protein/signal transduction histidine kinase
MKGVIHLAVTYFLLASAAALAQPINGSPPAAGPPWAQVDPNTVHLDMTDGSDLRLMRLSRSQGLSQQRVAQIVQDDRGFLWFGTQYGLNRYDGYRFRVFKNDPLNADSVCDVYIAALFKDHAGQIWVGCTFSVDRYDPVTEKFVHYKLEPAPVTHTSGDVRHISEDRDGILWLSTGNGLYSLNPSSGRVQRFAPEKDNPYSLNSTRVKFSGEDRSGAFWVATEKGLDQFDRQTRRVTLHVPLPENVLIGFFEDREGNFWIWRTSGDGLAILDRRTRRVTRYSFASRKLRHLALTGVISMVEGQDGSLWIGTLSDGVLKFDREHQRFIRYRNDPANRDSLSENRINALFEDREGHIWIGFNASEPAFFAARELPFTKLPFDAHNQNNLGENLVNVIYEDRQGILWMGTTGALNRLDRKSGQFTHMDLPGGGVTDGVLSVLEDPSGDALWIGTSGQGLYRLDTKTNRLRAFRRDEKTQNSLSNNGILRLFYDSRGRLWIGTFDGLNRFNPATETFTTYRHGDRTTLHVYRSIVEDKRGKLWVDADGDGVQSFDPVTERFTPIRLQRKDQSPFLYKRVQSLHVDHAGAVWAGTGNGLYRYDVDSGVSTAYTERDGLPSNTVSCVFEDRFGDLWLGTSNGLSRLDRSRRVFKNYSTADGLPGLDFTGYSACYRGKSGDMFFGGFAGAVSFRPENVKDVSYAPPVALTGFQLFGVPVAIGRPGSPLSRAIDYTSAVTLAHDQNSFSIEFAALSFFSPTTNRYRYRLEGLEDQWHEVGSDQRFASYTTLPSGDYRFRVQGATSRGPWSEPGVTLAIQIQTPWWDAWWFKALLALLVLAMIVGAYLLRVRQLAEQFDIRLDERVNERTRIARELHDSLLQSFQGLIYRLQAARALLPDRTAEATLMLETALDRGDRAIDEGRAAVMELRSNTPVTLDIADSIAALGDELVNDGKDAHSFRLIIEGKVRPVAALVRDDMYLIAREALRNVIQHSHAKKIEAEVHYGDSALILRIRDDGIGVDVSSEGRRVGHWGLQGMRERADSFGGHLEVWSERGAGTEIELSVPARIAYGHAVATHRSFFGIQRFWRRS